MVVAVARISLALLVAFCLLVSAAFSQQGDAAPVSVLPVQEYEIAQEIQLSGTVTALSDAQLSVSIGGLVTLLKVDAGDRVEKGDELLALDSELARYQYESAHAVLKQAQHALADARRRLEEAKALAPQRSIAESVVKDLAAEVLEDEAALEEARAQAGYRKGILDRHRLIAPFTGVISSRSVELGEWVSPGQAVLRLVSAERLILDFQVPEDFLGQISVGTPVNYTLGADRDTIHVGSVVTSVPVTDDSVRTFLLRVQPEAGRGKVLPGMSAQALLKVGTNRLGVAVPRDAVLRYADGRVVVWVVQEETGQRLARERFVKAGLNFGGKVEIRQGLEAGEVVVIKGNESLRDGQAVSIFN